MKETNTEQCGTYYIQVSRIERDRTKNVCDIIENDSKRKK